MKKEFEIFSFRLDNKNKPEARNKSSGEMVLLEHLGWLVGCQSSSIV